VTHYNVFLLCPCKCDSSTPISPHDFYLPYNISNHRSWKRKKRTFLPRILLGISSWAHFALSDAAGGFNFLHLLTTLLLHDSMSPSRYQWRLGRISELGIQLCVRPLQKDAQRRRTPTLTTFDPPDSMAGLLQVETHEETITKMLETFPVLVDHEGFL